MPAFTFEKISSPVRSNTQGVAITPMSKQVVAKKSRGLIVQMLDRFALNRLRQDQGDADLASPRHRPPPD